MAITGGHRHTFNGGRDIPAGARSTRNPGLPYYRGFPEVSWGIHVRCLTARMLPSPSQVDPWFKNRTPRLVAQRVLVPPPGRRALARIDGGPNTELTAANGYRHAEGQVSHKRCQEHRREAWL